MGFLRLLQCSGAVNISYSRLLALRRKQLLSLNRTCTEFMKRSFASSSDLLIRFRQSAGVIHGSSLLGCKAFHTGENEDSFSETSDNFDGIENSVADEEEEFRFLREICAIPDAGHQVMVIQPAVKWGPKKRYATTPELQLAELCALVSTLPNWKVVQQKIVSVKEPQTAQIFGSGNFKQLKQEILDSHDISAIVLGIDILSGVQLSELNRAWKVPVFDRYTIVLQIFKDHAHTKEAKLQVALAEIPFVRSRLSQIHDGDYDRQVGGASLVGGTGETYISTRRQILQEKEVKLKKALQKLKNQRSLLRQNRLRSKIPLVAVVGYTNSGKTTLIKALTGDAALEPKDQLFATLDVTAHAGRMPNNMTVIFMDTVGFISDIPTALIDAFSATLEDAVLADVVVHVRDISHPDTVAQKQNVQQTLSRMLSAQQLDSMIEVCNKADKGTVTTPPKGAVVTSAVSGDGLGELRQLIQDGIIQSTAHLEKRFRIPMQGPMLAWLYKEATVKSAEPCPYDAERLVVDVVISQAAYARFQKTFSRRQKNEESRQSVNVEL